MSIVSAPVLKIYFGRSLAAEDTKTENRKQETGYGGYSAAV
jgi:hypothetical protein